MTWEEPTTFDTAPHWSGSSEFVQKLSWKWREMLRNADFKPNPMPSWANVMIFLFINDLGRPNYTWHWRHIGLDAVYLFRKSLESDKCNKVIFSHFNPNPILIPCQIGQMSWFLFINGFSRPNKIWYSRHIGLGHQNLFRNCLESGEKWYEMLISSLIPS